MIASFSSSGKRAGTIPDVNMLLINSRKPEKIDRYLVATESRSTKVLLLRSDIPYNKRKNI